MVPGLKELLPVKITDYGNKKKAQQYREWEVVVWGVERWVRGVFDIVGDIAVNRGIKLIFMRSKVKLRCGGIPLQNVV